MSFVRRKASTRHVAANQANAQRPTGLIRKSERPKPESLFPAATSNIAMRWPPPIPKRAAKGPTAEVASSAIAKAGETGTRPNDRNEPPKPESNLESRTSRIVHAAGRPIAKAGETSTAAQPDRRNGAPRPGSADLGCKSLAVPVKKSNQPRNLEAETPRHLTACWFTLPAAGVTRRKE